MNPLRIIKRFLDKFLGSTRSDKLFWQFRHFLDRNWANSYISEQSLNHPHRGILIEKISNYYPFEKVLEVGSASGPNLYLLAQKFPQVNFYGIDVSGKAVADGKKFFAKKGINNVFLQSMGALQLESFGDKSIDVVFSDAALIYIGLDKIDFVLREMSRIAKKAIILCEQHTEERSFYDDKWVHNYEKIIGKILPMSKSNFTKISKDIWGGDWGKFGYIIEIIL